VSIYLVTGWPGAGKSTVAVEHAITRYASAGRRVVANFPIDFAPVCVRRGAALSKASVQVIPDRPSRADLDAIGVGGEREDTAGMLIVDEAIGWLNARSWQGRTARDGEGRALVDGEGKPLNERELVIDWLTQSRKRFWDVYLIAQAATFIDKQAREGVCELVVRIRRLDRFKVGGVGLPRVHIAIVRYGLEQQAPVVERWMYRGADAHKCFGSYRLFGSQSAHYSVLPADQTRFARETRRVLNESGRRMAWIGIVGSGLMAILAVKVALLWLLALGVAGWMWGHDTVKPKRLWFVERYKRWRGWGSPPPSASSAASVLELRAPRAGRTRPGAATASAAS